MYNMTSMNDGFGLIRTSFQELTVLQVDWMASIILIFLSMLIISRQTQVWQYLMLSVTMAWSAAGLKIPMLWYFFAVIIFTVQLLTSRIIQDAVSSSLSVWKAADAKVADMKSSTIATYASTGGKLFRKPMQTLAQSQATAGAISQLQGAKATTGLRTKLGVVEAKRQLAEQRKTRTIRTKADVLEENRQTRLARIMDKSRREKAIREGKIAGIGSANKAAIANMTGLDEKGNTKNLSRKDKKLLKQLGGERFKQYKAKKNQEYLMNRAQKQAIRENNRIEKQRMREEQQKVQEKETKLMLNKQQQLREQKRRKEINNMLDKSGFNHKNSDITSRTLMQRLKDSGKIRDFNSTQVITKGQAQAVSTMEPTPQKAVNKMLEKIGFTTKSRPVEVSQRSEGFVNKILDEIKHKKEEEFPKKKPKKPKKWNGFDTY